MASTVTTHDSTNLIQKVVLSNSSVAPGAKTMPNHVASVDDDEAIIAKAAVITDAIAFPMTMQAAVELGVLDIIASKEKETGRPVSATEVAAELKTDNPLAGYMVDRMLRLLTAFSVVSCSVDEAGGRGKVYGVTPVGRLFANDEDDVSFGPLVSMHQHKVSMEAWYKLKDAVLEGGVPFDTVHGMNQFEYTGLDPKFNKLFNRSMANSSAILMKRVLQSNYKGFENINTLVDVGGGLGQSLSLILSKYPTIKGINYDLPHVVKHGLSHPGMEHVGGSFFESVPSADVVFMKWTLHDWGDEYVLMILKNCHRALPPNGKMIVIDHIMPDIPDETTESQIASQRDLMLLTLNVGGKERTQKEFLALAQAAGFAGIRLEVYVCAYWIMEFYK